MNKNKNYSILPVPQVNSFIITLIGEQPVGLVFDLKDTIEELLKKHSHMILDISQVPDFSVESDSGLLPLLDWLYTETKVKLVTDKKRHVDELSRAKIIMPVFDHVKKALTFIHYENKQ